MDFTPHTDTDVAVMLDALGLNTPADLFAHIPSGALLDHDPGLPEAHSELELIRMVDALGSRNRPDLTCFAGGGYYDHYLPPVVSALTMRPEFVTAYTPYQPEVSQGVLQALFEFQSMVCEVTGMDVANASLYDGATAAVEAVNLAVAATSRNAVWVSRGVHPRARETIATFAAARGIEVVEHELVDGRTVWDESAEPAPAAVIVAQPNYLGVIEDYDRAASVAHTLGALAVSAVDPMTLGLLRNPGSAGLDVVVAEGQPLGNPLSFGGPVVGLFATTVALMRRIPGRLVGQTVDRDGNTAYVLTLRAREQDIRRAKASSNICTNQTLNALASAIHLGWLGPEGLREVGEQSAQKAHYLADRLAELPGVETVTKASFVREFAVNLPKDPDEVIAAMAERGFLAGISLGGDYPTVPHGMLIAVTEKRSKAELDGYVTALKEVLAHG
ncbi:MAG: aminomethyl-transferring glycine dehydrogenase subunit GcvPA [Acidimicrobiia bacterium]|nr:aminomethyl-transferring glycine dehydrogenase subunit GcvPA [Acidimicrobiia bacterium]